MQEAPALQQQLPAAASLTTSNSSFVDMMDEQGAGLHFPTCSQSGNAVGCSSGEWRPASWTT